MNFFCIFHSNKFWFATHLISFMHWPFDKKVDALGSKKGSQKGVPKGSKKGSQNGSKKGSQNGSQKGSQKGSKKGSKNTSKSDLFFAKITPDPSDSKKEGFLPSLHRKTTFYDFHSKKRFMTQKPFFGGYNFLCQNKKKFLVPIRKGKGRKKKGGQKT